MQKEDILKNIRKELKNKQDLVYRDGCKKFFKEEVNPLGVRTPDTRRIAKEGFKLLEDKNKQETIETIELMLSQEYDEQKTVAFIWLSFLEKETVFEKGDFELLEGILKKNVSNWAHCDEFCTHTIGPFLLRFPELISKVKEWTKSENRWLKRAASVSLIYPVRKEKKFLKEIFFVAKALIEDGDDLVQKGYGWALKEGSNLYTKEVFDFVARNKKIMPRVALRCAIEKMPKAMKRLAMEK